MVLTGVILASGLSGCGRALTGAATAIGAGLFVSDAQEQAIGAQAAQQVLAQTPLVANASLQSYIGALGQQIVAVSDRKDIPYQFFVVQDATPHAFALPGGYIFVTSSLLALVENEAQLAGVLAHEVGHVAAHHHTEMIRETAIAQGVTAAAVGTDAGITSTVANIVAQLVLRGFGRKDELEADTLGATYASRLDYDPSQLATFLQRLDAATGGSSPAWLYPLETHPPVAQRVQQLAEFIAAHHLTGTKTNATQFSAGIQ
jgi:predicted Zn-dependent protease